jgi:hypothetical protein
MALTLADIATVRDRGALDAPPVAGAITDAQIDAAVLLAALRLRDIVGYGFYLDVTEIADGDTTVDPYGKGWTNGMKKQDFVSAESYLALARLEKISQIGKMTASGTPMTSQIGREVKTFAPGAETVDTGLSWEKEAYRCLAPYIQSTLLPAADPQTGLMDRVTTSNQQLRMAYVG